MQINEADQEIFDLDMLIDEKERKRDSFLLVEAKMEKC